MLFNSALESSTYIARAPDAVNLGKDVISQDYFSSDLLQNRYKYISTPQYFFLSSEFKRKNFTLHNFRPHWSENVKVNDEDFSSYISALQFYLILCVLCQLPTKMPGTQIVL